MEGAGHFAVDDDRVAAEARFDGIWVLRTSTAHPTATVTLQYKRLWMVEAMIRTTKAILETRPIYHKCDETIRGHVFCSFLALRLKAELEKRLEARGEDWEWAEVLRGPLVRGDIETVRRHLEVLQALPEARAAYVALARSAIKTLPVKNKKDIELLLRDLSSRAQRGI